MVVVVQWKEERVVTLIKLSVALQLVRGFRGGVGVGEGRALRCEREQASAWNSPLTSILASER